ncbi:hypothetical protein [Streptomyces sp. NPDC085937]|uniref:hypothetical protein n=1 Tax=Streptomyces sp. NPDC085937 TaxID=3365742 RepID=UPI0037D67901
MGVFARLFRRSKTTEETASAEARTDGATAGTGTDDTDATAQPEAAADAPETPGSTAKESDEVTVTESVDIPKQQSGKAADSEAGDGART